MAITKQEIINAAEALQAAGTNPTMNAVREALGGGSFATISPILRDWRDSKGQRATVAIEMPGEAKSALERAGVDLWKIITALATEKLTKVQEEAEKAVNSANAERDESLTEIERLETQASQKTNDIDEALKANELMSEALNKATNEIRALELKVADKARIEDDNERLKLELTELRSENKVFVDEKIKLIGQVKDLENKLFSTEKELSKANGHLNEKESMVAKLQAEAIDLMSKIKDLDNELLSTQKELAKASEQFKEKDTLATKLQTQNNTFDLQVQKLQLALDASESKSTDFKSEVAELRKSIGAIQREAGALTGELKAITTENKALKGELEKRIAKEEAGK